VRIRVDEELTVEVRALEPTAVPRQSAMHFANSGAGKETGTELDALFADVRQRLYRRVPDLP
jgi:hypothetical protein